MARALRGDSARQIAEDLSAPFQVRKWLGRYAAEGREGLRDRSCRPHRSPAATPARWSTGSSERGRQRWTGTEIAARRVGVSRHGEPHPASPRARPAALLTPRPAQRYEGARRRALHLDIKSLGRIRGVGHRITGDRRNRVRGIGWEYVHVGIDDACRLAYVEVLRPGRARGRAFL